MIGIATYVVIRVADEYFKDMILWFNCNQDPTGEGCDTPGARILEWDDEEYARKTFEHYMRYAWDDGEFVLTAFAGGVLNLAGSNLPKLLGIAPGYSYLSPAGLSLAKKLLGVFLVTSGAAASGYIAAALADRDGVPDINSFIVASVATMIAGGLANGITILDGLGHWSKGWLSPIFNTALWAFSVVFTRYGSPTNMYDEIIGFPNEPSN